MKWQGSYYNQHLYSVVREILQDATNNLSVRTACFLTGFINCDKSLIAKRQDIVHHSSNVSELYILLPDYQVSERVADPSCHYKSLHVIGSLEWKCVP